LLGDAGGDVGLKGALEEMDLTFDVVAVAVDVAVASSRDSNSQVYVLKANTEVEILPPEDESREDRDSSSDDDDNNENAVILPPPAYKHLPALSPVASAAASIQIPPPPPPFSPLTSSLLKHLKKQQQQQTLFTTMEGPRGSGKTHLALCLCSEWVGNVCYIDFREVSSERAIVSPIL